MKIIKVLLKDAPNFDQILAEQIAADKSYKIFALFFGAENPATGESWCPDCVIADPKIRSFLSKVQNSVLLECSVGSRSEWKEVGSADHPYKTNQKLKVKNIPTLIRWSSDGQEIGRLVEDDTMNESKLQKLSL